MIVRILIAVGAIAAGLYGVFVIVDVCKTLSGLSLGIDDEEAAPAKDAAPVSPGRPTGDMASVSSSRRGSYVWPTSSKPNDPGLMGLRERYGVYLGSFGEYTVEPYETGDGQLRAARHVGAVSQTIARTDFDDPLLVGMRSHLSNSSQEIIYRGTRLYATANPNRIIRNVTR